MQWLFMCAVISLVAVASAEAKVVTDEPVPAVAGQARTDAAERERTNTPPPRVRDAQVDVRLDAMEAMERLQELQIKGARRVSTAPDAGAEDRPEK